MPKMLLAFEGKQVPIDDEYLEEYRRTTGMDVDDRTYIPYCASNEGVSCKEMSVEELGAMVRRMMAAEIEVAREFVMNKNDKISVIKEDTGWYVATDVATGVASQGKTYESAVSNLEEALELHYENTTDCKDKSQESIVDRLYGVASNLDYKTLDDVRDDRLRKYVEPSVNEEKDPKTVEEAE